MKVPNGMKSRFRKGEREGIIDGLTELVVGLGRNSHSGLAVSYHLTVGVPD